MTHETHIACDKRFKQKGHIECCFCSPHSHCEFSGHSGNCPDECNMCKNLSEDKLCGRMILTPSPFHNGGLTCAEKVPCKIHDCTCNKVFIEAGSNIEYKITYCPIHPTAIRNGEHCECHCSACGDNYHCGNTKCGIPCTPSESVEPSNWEKEFDEQFPYAWLEWEKKGEVPKNKFLEIKDFIRTEIQLESDKAYRRGQRDVDQSMNDYKTTIASKVHQMGIGKEEFRENLNSSDHYGYNMAIQEVLKLLGFNIPPKI